MVGPATNQADLEKLQPLLDSLQHMLPPSPGGAGYSASGEVPVSFRPGDPNIASGKALGLYYSPGHGSEQENIVLDPEMGDPRFTAMHEFGHGVDWRDPKGETGWLSPGLREAIYGGQAPFDTKGRYGTDKPDQRMADYVGEGIEFLQMSKNPAIDPEYTRQYLSERPHLQRLTEELLQIPIYQEHPFLTGSLGEAYEPEPEPEPEPWPTRAVPDFTPAQTERIDELAREIGMGMRISLQGSDTDAMLEAVQGQLDARTGPRYTSRFYPASSPIPPR